jgi:hypothetical protein
MNQPTQPQPGWGPSSTEPGTLPARGAGQPASRPPTGPSQAVRVVIGVWMALVLLLSGVAAYAGIDYLVTKQRVKDAVEQFGQQFQDLGQEGTTP